ncbi:Gan [Symbiodinium pilosum]|uniref:Gan protein n=1 Tax=Symbiodinium pilosum TaxID=2952 RepID=A0A812WP61_SYMPI|nr:Gan [Symbiodinium pilosum]
MSLLFLPFFESNFELPELDTTIVVGICATGILVFELLLTELTSPLTVSVLGVMHNVVIVLFFTLLGERMSTGQATAMIVAEDSHLIVSLLCVSLPWQLLALECA